MAKTIYTKDHKFLVRQLKNARKEANLDQTEASRILGKTQSYLSKVESGQRRLDIIQLKKFARIYKKPLSYFIK
jgi:transcriptional regulator with XRE-family HTH domain